MNSLILSGKGSPFLRHPKHGRGDPVESFEHHVAELFRWSGPDVRVPNDLGDWSHNNHGNARAH
jgi:hypothetical protein